MKRNLVESFLNVDNPELDNALADLGKVAPTIKILSAINPLNVTEERERWIESIRDGYQPAVPEFIYSDVSLSLLEEKEEKIRQAQLQLQTLFPNARARVPVESVEYPEPDFLLAGLGLNVAQRALARIGFLRAFQTEDDTRMTRASIKTFKAPTRRLFAYASRVLREEKLYGLSEERSFGAEQIRRAFSWVLERYSLADRYVIEIAKNVPAINVGFPTATKPGTIKIPETRVVPETKLRTLVAHEIECHVLDRLNSEMIFHNLPRVGQEFLSEGHAIYVEESLNKVLWNQTCTKQFPGNLSNESRRSYSATYLEKALLYQGITLARHGRNFNDVANVFLRYYRRHPELISNDELFEKVWNLTLRIFRGCRNPNGRGVFTKDCAYLAGVDYVGSHPWNAWLATGISDVGWLEYLRARFTLDKNDLPAKSLNLAISPEFSQFILQL